MADTSTKGISATSKTTYAGKNASTPTPEATNATTRIPTLKDVARSLVALEMDLADMTKQGVVWLLMSYPTSTGKEGLVAFLYHPDCSFGVEDMGNNNLVATIDGLRASEVATRKG